MNGRHLAKPIQPAILNELAGRVERLIPSRKDPEEFFVERSEIAHELRKIARGARVLPGSYPYGSAAPKKR